MKLRLSFITILCFLAVATLTARENAYNLLEGGKVSTELPPNTFKGMVADCDPPTAQTYLEINNIKAGLLNGGDLWWDGNANPMYEAPKVPVGSGVTPKHSIFAGALWIGGVDPGGQLKVSAMTYRQDGNDFWPGPLDTEGNVEETTCSQFDRFFEVKRSEIDELLSLIDANGGNALSPSQVPESLLQWPGKNNPHFSGTTNGFNLPPNKNLAPFLDIDDDGIYDPTVGDYPIIGTIDDDCEAEEADQMIWWVFNDVGNIHTETGGEAIGLEIGALAFGFATNDEINNMTFYKYDIQNRATVALDNAYFAQWVDPDLGEYQDDFVGCNVEESLGFVYNGDDFDEGSTGYGDEIPILGVDYFKGPKSEEGQEIGMSAFVYYNNDFTDTGNPENAAHYYGYMSGFWKNGSPITEGGDGTDVNADPTPYMYPSDPSDNSEGAWSECSIENDPADRRFLQVSGPFRLAPGASNSIVVGVVWVPNQDYPCPSLAPLLTADKKAQALFDNCFELLDGPDAPSIAIRELDKELAIALFNESGSNNEGESYDEFDPLLSGFSDSTYTFQGYQVYQLKDATVSATDLNDPSKAKLVFQADIKDEVDRAINYVFDASLNAFTGELKVDGQNAGISKTFSITTDAFSNSPLVNQKRYYFTALAYAYNQYEAFQPGGSGQLLEYLPGRLNINTYVGIPHLPPAQIAGGELNTAFGDGAAITTLGGTGNGGNYLKISEESEAVALAPPYMDPTPTYQPGFGPIAVKVYDPFRITGDTYRVTIEDEILDTELVEIFRSSPVQIFEDPNTGLRDTLEIEVNPPPAGWTLIADLNPLIYYSEWSVENMNTGEVATDVKNIVVASEQALMNWDDEDSEGLTVAAGQVSYPSPDDNSFKNDKYLGWNLEVDDFTNACLTFFPDVDAEFQGNWLRTGSQDYQQFNIFDDYNTDPDGIYANVADRLIGPYCLTGAHRRENVAQTGTFYLYNEGMAFNTAGVDGNAQPLNTLADLHSVDIVFTPNKELWTRCPVIETGNEEPLNEGNATKFFLRNKTSIDKNGEPVTGSTGWGWFPGYAIDIETGTRLNLIYGENSTLGADNGRDMMWNPNEKFRRDASGQIVLGGMHYTYVMFSKYDEGQAHYNKLATGDLAEIATVYDDAQWAFVPMDFGECHLPYSEGVFQTDMRVEVRVSTPYEQLDNDGDGTLSVPTYEFGIPNGAPRPGTAEEAETALDLVKVVPNPYYAYSAYETSQLDNRVKITNLPPKCDIGIYTLDGTLVRRFKVDSGEFDFTRGDNSVNTVDWNLKNSKNINIASGMYIIHINAEGIGERTIKWFGVMRPVDLDTF